MKIFYGAAIQGTKDSNERTERARIHRALIDVIKNNGYDVVSEHTAGRNKEETAILLERAIGPLPSPGSTERTVCIRKGMIAGLEGDICAAIFETSTPSIGTGIELTHAYMRPRKGLPEIPILALYQTGYWSHDLSSMVRGITAEDLPNFRLKRYERLEDAENLIKDFLSNIKKF